MINSAEHKLDNLNGKYSFMSKKKKCKLCFFKDMNTYKIITITTFEDNKMKNND